MLTPIDRNSLADEVAKRLRMEILTGSLKPGERILEQEISTKMNTSRGPVRDALILLEHEGLVDRERNRSATVVSMTSDDAEEVHSLRLALELLALRYVMERAKTDDLIRLEEAIEPLRSCLRENFSLQDAVDFDLYFHEMFVDAARHNRVLSMWQSIKPQIWFLIYTRNAFNIENFETAVESHVAILECIRNGNHKKAKNLLTEHLDDAYIRVIETFRKPESEDVQQE